MRKFLLIGGLLATLFLNACAPCKVYKDHVITDVWTVPATGTTYYSVDYGPGKQIPQSKAAEYYVGRVMSRECVER